MEKRSSSTGAGPHGDALVVGLGSIGRRHAHILSEMGWRVAVVTAQNPPPEWVAYRSIQESLDDRRFSYCVISSPTARHEGDIRRLAECGFDGRLLVEKPLVSEPALDLPIAQFERVGVGYNLRFHPAVKWLRRRFTGDGLLVDVAAQSYLPEWRPGRDYRSTASATREAGGGVLRDLSHELDLLLWLFGPLCEVSARTGAGAALDLDVECACVAVMKLRHAEMATLRLSCVDRLPERRIRVTTGNDTLEIDLRTGLCRTQAETTHETSGIDDTYRDLHAAMLADDAGIVCTAEEASRVVEAIARIEASARWGDAPASYSGCRRE